MIAIQTMFLRDMYDKQTSAKKILNEITDKHNSIKSVSQNKKRRKKEQIGV